MAGPNPIHHVVDEEVLGLSREFELVWLFRQDIDFHAAALGPLRLVLTKHMIGVTIAALMVLLFMILVARRVKASALEGRAPQGRLANLFEVMILYVRNEMVLPNMGPQGITYLPWFLTFFFFILFCNLLGLFPEIGTPTGNIGVTTGLAAVVFFMIFVFGSIEQGGVRVFMKNLVPSGLPFWLVPMMFVIELVGPVTKCFALAVRLFANMFAGHVVIAALLGLGAIFHSNLVSVVGMFAAVAMDLLEVFVAFLQAYIFTLLAIVFVGAAVHPEH